MAIASHTPRLLAWSPIANGFFAAVADLGAERFEAYRTPANLERPSRATVLGAERGVTGAQVALAWVLGQSFAPLALIGTTSPAHLAEAIAAVDLRLTADEMGWLEGVPVTDGGDAAAAPRPPARLARPR